MRQTAVMIVGTGLLQQSLAVLLERHGMAVVGTCGADEALAMVRERRPEVVVVDMPGRERPILSYLPHLTSMRPAPRVICVCRDPSRADLTAAEDRYNWDVRVFTERQQSLPLACEVPVLIEQRLFELAREIRARMQD